MKIQFASDLHLEMAPNSIWMEENSLIPSADILILAGDITHLHEDWFREPYFDTLSSQFKKVYMIAGNHEFYRYSFDIEGLFPSMKIQVRKNIVYLNNQVIKQGNVRLLFTTLFTHITNHKFIDPRMNDFRVSKYKDERFSTHEYNECHALCLAFLKTALAKPFEGKTVVVSHHAPYPPYYCDYPDSMSLNEAFHTDLLWLTEKNKIDHWIHGHTHHNQVPLTIGKTTFHTNQLGYTVANEHGAFRRDMVLEI
ncbi:metallophosphoesterase [uncultured Imperialibacter sp.]|uniref:metallophosphoesterase n=1 Tax=Imperialibacter sp. TaxID=2038411 RepID=UPI0030DCCF4B